MSSVLHKHNMWIMSCVNWARPVSSFNNENDQYFAHNRSYGYTSYRRKLLFIQNNEERTIILKHKTRKYIKLNKNRAKNRYFIAHYNRFLSLSVSLYKGICLPPSIHTYFVRVNLGVFHGQFFISMAFYIGCGLLISFSTRLDIFCSLNPL